MNKPLFALLASGIVLVAACGSTVVDSSSGAGADKGSSSSSSSSSQSTSGFVAASSSGGTGGSVVSGGTGGGSPAATCPSAPPTPNSPCTFPEGVRCTYGTGVAPDCRDQYFCTNGAWDDTEPGCPMTPPSFCPATEPTNGASCGTTGGECIYGDDICECGCGGGIACQDFSWSCAPPPAAPCPKVVPNTGVACSDEGMSCTYGNPCEGGVITQCMSGEWTWEQVACGG